MCKKYAKYLRDSKKRYIFVSEKHINTHWIGKKEVLKWEKGGAMGKENVWKRVKQKWTKNENTQGLLPQEASRLA